MYKFFNSYYGFSTNQLEKNIYDNNNKKVINISRILLIIFILFFLLSCSIIINLILCTNVGAPMPIEYQQSVVQLSESVENLSKQTGELSTKSDALLTKIENTRRDSNGQLILVCLIVSANIFVQTLVWIFSR